MKLTAFSSFILLVRNIGFAETSLLDAPLSSGRDILMNQLKSLQGTSIFDVVKILGKLDENKNLDLINCRPSSSAY